VSDGLKRLDDRVLRRPLTMWRALLGVVYPPKARQLVDRLWESPLGWIVPGGAPWKLGRRDGPDQTLRGSWLIWGVWGERT
jgi:hypothetical protein